MISLTEDFNVSPNNIVSGIFAKWRFKKSGFFDVAASADQLQKRLQNYQKEEVLRAYEAVQQASMMTEEDEAKLVESEIVSKI